MKRGWIVRVLSHGRVAAEESFEREIEHLARRHAVVSAAHVLDTLEGGRPLPTRAVLLVFHDERSFTESAWAVLRRRGFAAALFVSAKRLEGAAREPSDGLLVLARQGVALGLSALERGAGASLPELRRALLDLEHCEPGSPRLYAHHDGPPDEARLEVLRAAGIELAFTTLPGSNDLRHADPLYLRSVQVDGLAPPARGERGWRPEEVPAPSTPEEQRAARTLRSQRRHLRFVLRAQDALLTAGVRPRPPFLATLRALTRRSSHYERLRTLAALSTRALPVLERRLQRALLDSSRLPFPAAGVELAGHGSAATVFRLLAWPGRVPQVLKVYRWTAGQPAAQLVQMARRHRARHALLCRALGESVLPAHFLVLHGPLRALPVAACLQERIERSTDLLALADEELLRLVSSRPELRAEFVGFGGRLRALRERGFFPDLLGAGNLVLVEPGARIRLLDYGLHDLRSHAPGRPDGALQACALRIEALLRALGSGSRPSSWP